jgi:hypothetical protein
MILQTIAPVAERASDTVKRTRQTSLLAALIGLDVFAIWSVLALQEVAGRQLPKIWILGPCVAIVLGLGWIAFPFVRPFLFLSL